MKKYLRRICWCASHRFRNYFVALTKLKFCFRPALDILEIDVLLCEVLQPTTCCQTDFITNFLDHSIQQQTCFISKPFNVLKSLVVFRITLCYWASSTFPSALFPYEKMSVSWFFHHHVSLWCIRGNVQFCIQAKKFILGLVWPEHNCSRLPHTLHS